MKSLIPSPLKRIRFKKFYECIAKIMEQQLLTMCISTLKDFINFIIHGQVNYSMHEIKRTIQ